MITFTVERAVTLSTSEVLETTTAEINWLETKSFALRLAHKHWGRNVRLEVYDGCYEVHDAGPVVRPSPTFLGVIYYS